MIKLKIENYCSSLVDLIVEYYTCETTKEELKKISDEKFKKIDIDLKTKEFIYNIEESCIKFMERTLIAEDFFEVLKINNRLPISLIKYKIELDRNEISKKIKTMLED